MPSVRARPPATAGPPLDGIERELSLLAPIRGRADVLIDTTGMTPHDLRAEIARLFASGEGQGMSVSVQSFSYKRGLPRGVDFVFDCRFLRNPHWDAGLRPRDGRDAAVADYVAEDPAFAPFEAAVRDLLAVSMPAQQAEGKAHLAIAFGCTGGQHRSVVLAERLAGQLAQDGWPVSKRHRELERRLPGTPGSGKGQDG